MTLKKATSVLVFPGTAQSGTSQLRCAHIQSRYSKENFPNILKLVEGLKRIGEKHNATAGQVALAWILAQGKDIIPIPGTRKMKV